MDENSHFWESILRDIDRFLDIDPLGESKTVREALEALKTTLPKPLLEGDQMSASKDVFGKAPTVMTLSHS